MPAIAPGRTPVQPAWRASPALVQFLSACLDLPTSEARLTAWCRDQSTGHADPHVRVLLPFALKALLAIDPNAPIVPHAQSAYLDNSRLNLTRMARLLSVLRRFDSEGIPCVVLKGAALAFRYYRSYGVRSMSDVDLLVRLADVERAAMLLADLGWTPPGDASIDLWSTRVRLQHARAFNAAGPHNLDLHWRVLNATSPDVEERIWAATETFRVGSTPVRVLGPTDQIFHLCAHAVQPTVDPSPCWIVDVLTILNLAGADVDWERLVDLARRTSTTIRISAAVIELRRLLGARIPESLVHALDGTGARDWQHRELALFTRMPPFARHDAFRWHWYQFRRLRAADPQWSRWPLLAGFADYARLTRYVRHRDRQR